jgi:NIMA-interacting peptidyl-prolyl cis-trans isomerase 1
MRVQSIAFLLAASVTVLACGGAPPKPTAPTPPEAASVAPIAVAPSSPPSSSSSSDPPSTPPAPTSAPTAAEPAPSSGALAGAPSASAKPKKIAARHVLIQWMGCQNAASSVVRTRDQARAVAQDVLRRVKGGEDFPRVVVEFSDEPNAGARGGSLGRFGHGAMVKEFEEAAFALKPGEVSGIVESPFGFHVIQRTE